MSMSDDIVNDASAFVDSLDRSVLGRFVVDIELLRMAEVMSRALALSKEKLNEDDGGDAVELLNKYRYRFYRALGVVSDTDVKAERIFWLLRQEPVAEFIEPNEDVLFRIGRLNAIAARPEFHDYFAVGIWDESIIQEAIEQGLDPMLTLSLQGGDE